MKTTLLAAAISGMVMGAASLSQAATQADNAAAPSVDDGAHFQGGSSGEKHACKGQNDCKGQGGCKTEKHACKGQNACKGQGGCKG